MPFFFRYLVARRKGLTPRIRSLMVRQKYTGDGLNVAYFWNDNYRPVSGRFGCQRIGNGPVPRKGTQRNLDTSLELGAIINTSVFP